MQRPSKQGGLGINIPSPTSDMKGNNNSPNLRLDAISLKAIARIVDDKLLDRDDRLLGQVKAMLVNQSDKVPQNNNNQMDGSGFVPRSPRGSVNKSANKRPANNKSNVVEKQQQQQSQSKQAVNAFVGKAGSVVPKLSPMVPVSSKSLSAPVLPHLPQIREDDYEDPYSLKPLAALSKLPWVTNPRLDKATSSVATSSDQSAKKKMHSSAVGSLGSAGSGFVEGIKYSQCRSLVYRPTAAGDDSVGVDEVVDTSIPQATLSLNHVHAYDGDTAKHGGAVRGKNVMFVGTDRIIFPAAALVVVMDINTCAQGFFSGHSEDVTCVTIHPDRAIAASGQMGKDGRILIWDSSVIQQGVREFNAAVELLMMGGIRGVCGVNFSGDGRFLVALGIDEAHSMVVFDWATAQTVATAKVGHSDVYQMGFNPYLYVAIDRIDELKMPVSPRENQESTDSCCYTLISCGGRQIKFWTLRRTLERTSDTIVQTSGFKGRKISVPKRKQQFSVKYVLEGNPGIFPKNGTEIPEMLCFVSVGDSEAGTGSNRYMPPKSRIFTGTSSGSIYIWQQIEEAEGGKNLHSLTEYSWQPRGRLLSVVTDVHDSPVLDIDYTGMYYPSEDDEDESEVRSERLITCGKDGIANVWRMDRSGSERTLPFEHVSTVGFSEPSIGAPRCVSWDLDGCNVIVGTTGNALLQLSGDGLLGGVDQQREELQPHIFVRPLIRAHQGKIRRVASHPTEPIFATISTDRTVRLWSTNSKSQISLTRLADKASCISFTPDGTCLAIGNETGELVIVSYGALALSAAQHEEDGGSKQWQVVFRRHIAAKVSRLARPTDSSGSPPKAAGVIESASSSKKKTELTELKYSPSGDILAVGCRDNLIHLLLVKSDYKRSAVCRGHSSYIRNIDFSVDGSILQATDAVRELLFWEVASGKQINNAYKVRDMEWHTWTCAYGWPVQGIFNGAQGLPLEGDMNAACRSHDGSLLVSGGSNTVNSAVKLFRYPCIAKALPALYGGHTSPVLDVTFLADDTEVVSIGGNDATIFVWTVKVKS